MGQEREKVLEVVRGALDPNRLQDCVIYWNSRTLKAGDAVVSSPLTVTMPFEGTVAFVDLAPGFNWAHPCLYVFIGGEPLQTKLIKSSLPPAMDRPGDDWRVLLRFGNKPRNDRDFDVFP
jgi:hypothetical protein